MDLPKKKYAVIYADPPWAWGKAPLVDRGAARTVEKEYPTMQPDEIKALPVVSIAQDRAALFMWATSPKLPLAFEVMKAWGFEYKSCAFVWVKKNKKSDSLFTGMGFYTRQNAEFVLLGTRGTPSLERLDKGVHQVIEEAEPIFTPVSAHSVKPEEVRQRIDRLFGGERIELFARRAAPGWDVWGNQAPECSIVETCI